MFDSDKNEPDKFRYDIKLTDIETKEIFYNKLTFIYLEMPKFNKTVDELETRFDKWLYVIRNLNRLDRIPDKLKEQIFEKLFETAEIARFPPEQVRSYEDSLKYYRDIKNSIDTARVEGKIEVAKNLLQNGVSIDIIVKSTGLTEKQIKDLK